MAIYEVKVPELSESVANGTLMQWHKKVGDFIAAGDVLIEIETDKIMLEVPAAQSGVLTEIVVNDGEVVTSGQLIAKIDTQAVAVTKATAEEIPVAALADIKKPEKISGTLTLDKSTVAMPAAVKLLAEKNLTTADVRGTGKDGRVTKGDVLTMGQEKPQEKLQEKPLEIPQEVVQEKPQKIIQAVSQAVSQEAIQEKIQEITQDSKPISKPIQATENRVAPKPPAGERTEERQPLSRLRMRVAQRLLESQQQTASLTTFNEVNMAPVLELRKKHQEQFSKENGVRLGLMSFFVKAAVHALKKFPVVNASMDADQLVYHNYYDIGVAISSPRGLVVPILRNADQMSFADIERQIADFAARAQEGRLTLEELSGGTFTITNGGVYGSMLSTPIINPPQSAILGIHATKERAVVEQGEIVIRPMCYLALSYDHRLIDGRESVQSLVAMRDALEDPARMLLDL